MILLCATQSMSDPCTEFELALLADRVSSRFASDDRPAEVSALAKAVYDYPKDHPGLEKAIEKAGFKFDKEVSSSGAWWVKKDNLEVMIVFGGPRKTARAFSWREKGGPTEKI